MTKEKALKFMDIMEEYNLFGGNQYSWNKEKDEEEFDGFWIPFTFFDDLNPNISKEEQHLWFDARSGKLQFLVHSGKPNDFKPDEDVISIKYPLD